MSLSDSLIEKLELLKKQTETATPQQFINRLENTILVAAYVEKRFQERFPAEHEEWSKRQEARDEETEG